MARFLPAFQTAWNLVARMAARAPLNHFLKVLLVCGDDTWHRDVLDERPLREVAHTREPEDWQRLAHGHPLDGLIATLHHLQVLSAWASSTADVGSLPESSGVASGEGARLAPESPAGRLVRSVGRLLRWRLDLAN